MTDQTDQQRWAFGQLVRYCRWVHRTLCGREPTLPALQADLRALFPEMPADEMLDRLRHVAEEEVHI